jgi:hypothetical protein
MAKKIKYGILTFISAVLVTGITHGASNNDIGFSKRFGGAEESRDIQIAIMNNTADQLTKTQVLAEQIGTMAANMDKMNLSMQAMQKSMERLATQMGDGGSGREQKDLLNTLVRYAARQQQINEQLLDENRKIRQLLEAKPNVTIVPAPVQ